ncbi:MAG: hypothetical protein A3G74_01195, partial [Sulfurimonas sp. RIFCSPLOWO2_12_FULL_34_6]
MSIKLNSTFSLKKVNFALTLFLIVIISGTFLYTYSVAKTSFKKEHISQIKGDILELGYLVSKFIEREGMQSSLNLLNKSLHTHKEYQTLSIALEDKIVVSTDAKMINTIYKNGLHIDRIDNDSLHEDIIFYRDFSYFNKDMEIKYNLIIDLNDEYLKSSEKEVQNLVATFVLYFVLIIVVFLLFLYFLNVYPIIKLNKQIRTQDFSPVDFLIEEHFFIYQLFEKKYNEIALLNKTLEEKVAQRTKELSKTNELFKEAQKLTRIGNWEFDTLKNKLICSDEMYEIFGQDKKELLSTYDSFLNCIYEDDRSLVNDSVKKTLTTKEHHSIYYRVILPNGEQKVVYEKARVEFDEENNPTKILATVQDITERYKRNRELELQSKLLNAVTDSIFVHNLDGSFVYVNEAACIDRGYTKEELLSMKVQDLDYHDEKTGNEVYKENIKKIQKELTEKGKVIFEVSHKTKDGRVIPLEVNCRTFKEDNKSYIISIARDISKIKAMYKNIEISEKQYRNLVENSQIGIFNTKISGDIVYVNDAILKIMGYVSQEEIKDKNIIHAYKESSQRDYFVNELVKHKKVEKIELVLLTRESQEKNVQVSAHLEGDIISGICTDITESKKAIDEIKKLSKAIEEIDDIIIITDVRGEITFVNDAFVRHTGYSREESIGQNASILKSGRHDKDFYKEVWDTLVSGNSFRGLFINRKKNAELYYEETTISSIKNDDDEITAFISTGKDITQRIEMEKNLEKLATTDKLTGIYNRHKFEEIFNLELNRVLRYESPLTLIMFDIDYFKKVNDTYGHDTGDYVLKEIVNIVKENIRHSDIFVRWGGEE